jgi:hypothetical protein
MDARERLDAGPPHPLPLLRRGVDEHPGGVVRRYFRGYPARDAVHHVEGPAEDRRVFLQPANAGHGDVRPGQAAHDVELARQVVLRKDVELRFETQDEVLAPLVTGFGIGGGEQERLIREADGRLHQRRDPEVACLRHILGKPAFEAGTNVFCHGASLSRLRLLCLPRQRHHRRLRAGGAA